MQGNRFRNVACAICNRRRPEAECTRGLINRVPVWVCKRCAADPQAAVDARQAAQQRAAGEE